MDGNGICLFGGFFMFTLSNLYIFNVVFWTLGTSCYFCVIINFDFSFLRYDLNLHDLLILFCYGLYFIFYWM